MESIATSVASALAKKTVEAIWEQIRYVLDYNDNIGILRVNLHDLKDAKDKVDHQVAEAERSLELIEALVRTWMSRADQAIDRGVNILAEDDKADKTCCLGWLPNFKNRYELSKTAKLEATAIAELTEKGKYHQVGYRLPLYHPLLPFDDYDAFESRESTLKSILDALRNRDFDLIGVWGLGGVGKTTLVKHVGRRMKEEGVFQLVVTAEVHPKADVKKIQERIAEWLDVKKEVEPLESIELRAALLHKRLLQEKSTLVILDDVWDVIDLKKVGIPTGADKNRCTVLVTTRHEHVVSRMAVQKQKGFRLDVLKDNEAWKLFKKTVGDIPASGLATKIVKKCGGLPILLLLVATTLKKKKSHVWEDALLRLQSGLQENTAEMQAQMYSALKLSYSYLRGDQRFLFLLCGLLLPYAIRVDDLVKYVTGLGLFKDYPTIKASRSRVLKLLGDLESSCLLLRNGNPKYLTMHEIVHSFAKRGSEDHHVFASAALFLVEEWPRDELEQLTHILLIYPKLFNAPTRLECPKLKMLVLSCEVQLDVRFFEVVKELKVLDLSEMHLSPLLPSIQHLQDLQTLCLNRCHVKDVAAIGNLGQLQILSMMGARIINLPKEIGKLVRLRILDLRDCRELKTISPGVLRRFALLEELYITNGFTQWGLRINAGLAELKNLKKLATLEIGLADTKNLPDDLVSHNLERFFIVIGDCRDWSRFKDVSRTLKVKLSTSVQGLKKLNVLLKKVEALHLDHSVVVKDAGHLELNSEGFDHHLKNLPLQDFKELKYLVYKGARYTLPSQSWSR